MSATPSLAAQLLQIVNSAYFGFAGRVTSVSRAVSLLGVTDETGYKIGGVDCAGYVGECWKRTIQTTTKGC